MRITPPCRRDRDGYCYACQAGPQDRCPASFSRRGFISMLGLGAITVIAPKVIVPDLTEANIEKVCEQIKISDYEIVDKGLAKPFSRAAFAEELRDGLMEVFRKVYYDTDRQMFIAETVPSSKVYSKDSITWGKHGSHQT